MPPTLVLLRHGESVHNAAQTFTGRLDVELSERGRDQARAAGRLLAAHRLEPDVVVTSPMRRCTATTDLVLGEEGLGNVVPVTSWRLAERDYGSLTDVPKSVARDLYGPEGYVAVRRTLDGAPPPATAEQRAAWSVAPYTEPGSGLAEPGAGETLRDVVGRLRPLWDELQATLDDGRTVLVVGHGNSLRALCLLVDDLTPEEVLHLNLPPGQPLVYAWSDGAARPRGGTYLDADDAHRAAARIAAEGGT